MVKSQKKSQILKGMPFLPSKFARNCCTKGLECTFAHSVEENKPDATKTAKFCPFFSYQISYIHTNIYTYIWGCIKTNLAIFGGMNIHFTSYLGFTRVPRFWLIPIYIYNIYIYMGDIYYYFFGSKAWLSPAHPRRVLRDINKCGRLSSHRLKRLPQKIAPFEAVVSASSSQLFFNGDFSSLGDLMWDTYM